MEPRGEGCENCNYTGTVRVVSYINKTVILKPCPRCYRVKPPTTTPPGPPPTPPPPIPPPDPPTPKKKMSIKPILFSVIILFGIIIIGWQLLPHESKVTNPPITNNPISAVSTPVPTQIIHSTTDFKPYPTNCIEEYSIKKAEYESKKFPLPLPEYYTGALVCNLGKVKQEIYEKDGKIYVFNFSSEEEAKDFVILMEDRYKRSNSDAYPRKDTIDPLEVYFRYSNNGQYRGSFYSYDKFVYYLDFSFTERDDRWYIENDYIKNSLPQEIETIVEIKETLPPSISPPDTTQPSVKSLDFVGTIVNLFRSISSDINGPRCDDGTHYDRCSKDKPYFCQNGSLILRASDCGCPDGFRVVEDKCEEIPKCNDGTLDGKCSSNKPYFCNNGTFILKASLCGCPKEEIAVGDSCVSKYQIGPAVRTLEYVVRGERGEIKYTSYSGLNDYLKRLPRSYICNPVCPTDEEIQLRYLDEKQQRKLLRGLVDQIKSETNDSDEQVRIAVSLVQHIPYDWEGLTTNSLNNRYPYEVIYDNKGVCGEKSKLLAFILRELGYGVVLFEYSNENHMAVGIKCPKEYSYLNSGYCFIESTSPTIITDSEGEYLGAGKLNSIPTVISISDGISFNSVSEEYNDAQEWNKIGNMGSVLNNYWYGRWYKLVNKYGMEID
jgi:hypothetical protein